ncbi:MAG: hypothetical protein IGS50_17395 [Synechococcales cyanobacterium C42_A2020_086]|jgi:hypothetical protein|nr:hypothetical protein [Synechococcales cyanobacterium C42_A2020_086]
MSFSRWVRLLKSLALASAALLTSVTLTLAHGVELSATIQAQTGSGRTSYSVDTLPAGAQVSSVQIQARYSTGEPMSGAQVKVFAPSDRSTPWQTGNCDAQGRFSFTPDPAQRGLWTVRVQAADHSNFINIPIR